MAGREPSDHLIYFLGFFQITTVARLPLKMYFQKIDYLPLFLQSVFLAQNPHLLIFSKELTIWRAFWP